MQHRIIEVIKEIMRKLLIAGYHILRPFIPVKKDMLIFDSSTGSNYTGSPRAVYERMVELGLDQKYDCVWMFQKGKAPKDLPGTARQVRFMRPAYFLAMSRAHVWIFDARQPEYIRKKRKQKVNL